MKLVETVPRCWSYGIGDEGLAGPRNANDQIMQMGGSGSAAESELAHDPAAVSIPRSLHAPCTREKD